ncbi:hypothetical protein GCM10020001_022650 [Nonomuraea salmonea]
MPASRCALTRLWLFWAFWPVLNMVARRPFEVRALSRLSVLPGLGPSSNVSPTYPALQSAAAAWRWAATAEVAVTARQVARIAPKSAVTSALRRFRSIMLVPLIV